MVKVEVDQLDVKKIPTDFRGRGYLGAEYSDSIVSVAIVSSRPKKEEERSKKD